VAFAGLVVVAVPFEVFDEGEDFRRAGNTGLTRWFVHAEKGITNAHKWQVRNPEAGAFYVRFF
jgi:hypothetical protein